jgi:NAD(P)H-hydrate epimerase
MRVLSRAEVRDVDRRAIDEFHVPGLLLMENAGRGCAELLLKLMAGVGTRVVICCGKGNNGGDGLVMARHLENAGIAVQVLLFAEPDELQGDAAVNRRIVQAGGIPLRAMPAPDQQSVETALATADWVVDALLGTGTTGAIREPYAAVIQALNASGRPVLAVDLPSGLDCDSGEPLGPCVRARHTATLVARKLGFDNPASEAWTGKVHVVEIGAPRRLLTYFDS